jgi:hypothetical protein
MRPAHCISSSVTADRVLMIFQQVYQHSRADRSMESIEQIQISFLKETLSSHGDEEIEARLSKLERISEELVFYS